MLGMPGLDLMQALSNTQMPARKVQSTSRAMRGKRMPGMSKNSQRKKSRTAGKTPKLGTASLLTNYLFRGR